MLINITIEKLTLLKISVTKKIDVT